MPIEMLDNTEGKRLGDSLRAALDDEAKLSIISAHVSLFAFGELREELERLDSVRVLFNEPTFISDMKGLADAPELELTRRAQCERERALTDSALELSLHNKLNQRALARACASWLREKVTARSRAGVCILAEGEGYGALRAARAHAPASADLRHRRLWRESPFVVGPGRHLHPGGTGS